MVDRRVVVVRSISRRIIGRERRLDGGPDVLGGRARGGALKVFGGRHRPPAVEHTACFRQGQYARLEETLRMFDFPIRPALEEFEVALIRIEGEPTALVAGFRNFLMGVTDVLEVEFPMFVGLIG